tara:strand:+ start:36 stop:653 length:618 start_codon:yes stop_codon:yes gene_type:complete
MDLRDIIELNRQLDLREPEALRKFVVLTKVQLLEIKKEDPDYYYMYIESLEAYFKYREESGREVIYKDDKNQAFEDLNVRNPIKEEEIIRQEEIDSAERTAELEALSEDEFNIKSVKSQQVIIKCSPRESPSMFEFSASVQATDTLAIYLRLKMGAGHPIKEIINKNGNYVYIASDLEQNCSSFLEEIREVADIKDNQFNTKYTR